MEQDLLMKYLMETREVLGSEIIDCPAELIPQLTDAEAENETEKLEMLNFVDPSQIQAFKDLREIIIPS